MMSSEEFVQLIKDEVRKELAAQKQERPRLGIIQSDYVSGRPRVRFHGESTTSTKTYPYLSSYTPAANDTVQLNKVGDTWVIQGKVV